MTSDLTSTSVRYIIYISLTFAPPFPVIKSFLRHLASAILNQPFTKTVRFRFSSDKSRTSGKETASQSSAAQPPAGSLRRLLKPASCG